MLTIRKINKQALGSIYFICSMYHDNFYVSISFPWKLSTFSRDEMCFCVWRYTSFSMFFSHVFSSGAIILRRNKYKTRFEFWSCSVMEIKILEMLKLLHIYLVTNQFWLFWSCISYNDRNMTSRAAIYQSFYPSLFV